MRGNVRVDPKLVWMDSELVKAAATTIVTVERIVPEASFRAEPHRTTYPRFTVETVVEAPWGAYPTSCFPRYSYDGDFFRAYAAAHTRPGRRPGVLGRADRRPRDARGVPGRERRRRARCSRSPGGRRERRVHDRRADGRRRSRASSRTTRARSTAPSPSCPSAPTCSRGARTRPTSSWAASSIAIDADPTVDPRVDALGRPLGRRQHARQLGLRLLGVRAEPPLQHLRLPRRPDGRLRQRQQHDDRRRTSRRRCACRAAAGWRT